MFAKKLFYISAAVLCIALAYHLGARMAGAGVTTALQEVAVLSGQVANGGTIPLPHYADGSEAFESECRWTVGVAHESGTLSSGFIKRIECFTEGRTVRAFTCVQNDCFGGDDPQSATANYFVVAVRNDAPTRTQPATFGSVKARWR